MRTIFLFTILLLGSGVYAQSSLGLISHWDMNGNANDVSGNGHDGHLNFVTLAPDRFGNPDGAYYFNGSTSVITVPYKPDLNLTNYSLCAIINVKGFYSGLCQGNMPLCRGALLVTGSYCMNFSDNSHDGNDCYAVDSTQDVFTASAGTTAAPTALWYYTPTIEKDVWYKLIFTWDGTQFKTFVNGILKQTVAGGAGSMGSSTDSLAIGKDIFDGATYPYPFKGLIDDMRIYGRVLTDSEIVHYGDTCGKITSQPTPVVVSVGSNTTFTVNSAMAAAGYQWQQDAGTGFANLSNSGPYSGVTTPTLTITGVTGVMNNYHYRCLLSNWACSDTTSSVPLTTTTTDVNTIVSNDMVGIYPNPAHNSVSVQLPFNRALTEVSVVNEIGQVVSSVRFTGNSHVLDIADLSPGMYILKVKGDDFTAYKKVLKQ